MSHRLLSNYFSPGLEPARSPASPSSLAKEEHNQLQRPPAFDAELVLNNLRQAIAAGRSEPDVLLKAIAEAAQALTSANGAAIALAHDGAVVCCARSGETAPTVGTRLSVDSGISGECLRSGEALHCDDSYTDHRVDPMVCRVLGLRSVAIVPVIEQGKATGILETFSTRAYAFNARHMACLKQLSELTMSVYAGQHKSKGASPVLLPEFPPTPLESARRLAPTYRAAAVDFFEKLEPGRKHRVTGLVLATLALASLLLGWTLHRPKTQAPSAGMANSEVATAPYQPATGMPEEEEIMVPAGALGLRQKPSTRPAAHRSGNDRHSRESREDSPEVVTRIINASEIKDSPAVAPVTKTTVSSDTEPVPEPKLELARSDNAALKDLLAGPARTPKFTPPVSAGVSPGALLHKVQPIYPPDARAMGLRGSVSLQITILKDGTVRDAKVVEGNPILGRAATDAVRQWRYRPTLLNGKPVQTQAEVVVNFQTP